MPSVVYWVCRRRVSKQAEVSGPVGRRAVANNQPYEVSYCPRKPDVTREQARELIRRIVNDRVKLNAAAADYSGSEVDRNCGALGGNRNSRAPNESYYWLPA